MKSQFKVSRMNMVAVVAALLILSGPLQAGTSKPNILVIFGDDIGFWNVSYNNDGMMGYRTPNIDRLAKVVTGHVMNSSTGMIMAS